MRGVYFLASDGVLDLAIAFLNSCRRHNPHLPLCLIPFDSEIDELCRLQPEYGFAILDDASAFDACDAIAAAMHGQVLGHYRKLAIWDGPFDEFIYIDVDTVVLERLDFVFSLLTGFDVLTSHSHLDGIVQWVWKPSARRCAALSPSQVAYSANTGFIASKRGVLGVAAARERLGAALAIRSHMVLACKEQAFLNYLIVSSGVRFSSLRTIAQALSSEGVSHRILLEQWAGNPHGVVAGGTAHSALTGAPFLLVHWAGQWQSTPWDRVLDCLRPSTSPLRLGLRPKPRHRLPYESLWRHYRWLAR